MDSSSHVARYASRIRGIAIFARKGLRWTDKLKMAVIGYARGHTFSAPGLISFLGRSIFPDVRVKPSLLRGLTLHLNPSDMSHLVVVDEILLEQVYPIDQVPFQPDLVVDCGANIGIFTLLAASRFPNSRLIAFEPDPMNIEWLRKHVDANGLVVEVIEAAVSTEDGEARFEAGLGVASAFVDRERIGGSVIKVRTLQLSRFIAEVDPRRLLLKLDVEGAEDDLFPDIIHVLPRDCSVFFETHGGERSWNQARQLLEKAGFSVTVIRRRSIYVEAHALRISAEMPK